MKPNALGMVVALGSIRYGTVYCMYIYVRHLDNQTFNIQ